LLAMLLDCNIKSRCRNQVIGVKLGEIGRKKNRRVEPG
jgi:hypothetical protein